MTLTTLITLTLIFFILVWGVATYNHLIRLKNEIANAFGQIDVQLKRRYDLIPNLVETAKKYLSHERETLEAVIGARNGAASACNAVQKNPLDSSAIAALTGAEATLTNQLGKLFALNERYPELKADQTIRELNEELTSTENRVGFARQAYNDSILAYNDQAGQFPAVLLAKIFGFLPLPMLDVIESDLERKAVRVNMQ